MSMLLSVGVPACVCVCKCMCVKIVPSSDPLKSHCKFPVLLLQFAGVISLAVCWVGSALYKHAGSMAVAGSLQVKMCVFITLWQYGVQNVNPHMLSTNAWKFSKSPTTSAPMHRILTTIFGQPT